MSLKQRNMRRIIAAAAIIIITVIAIGTLSTWYLGSLSFASSRPPRIWSVYLGQNGVGTFNLTNYHKYALTVTQASVTWDTSNSVITTVTSGNVVPSHQSLVLTISFGVNWQSGVRYDFLLSTTQGEQVAAWATG